ncbi:hypothetical protein HPP92_006553 [Vanilla planifolia]|uniref:Cholesterol oxidase n=1 Tax=Vanilla planifolia TaxID=51239 RepID=A0A835RK42_VANPL|nr:hypothetical protein HPP92_006553 [Vanilla planifolia]
MAEDESFDAVVVGSGYGGSVAACRMSMAGIRVCLVEKGRRWEAHDFPADVLRLVSAARLEWSKWGVAVGSQKALFQIREEGDSLAMVACGFGGGSLVNAGVVVPASVRARRDPKWPKEWTSDWEQCEALASMMLGAQPPPLEFSNGRVMRQVLCEEMEDYKPDPIRLSINFGKEKEKAGGEINPKKLGSCLACGNCFSGCPYNAKNSTDKNYLALAIKAGCTVRTETQILYVVKNQGEVCEHDDKICKRRWRVYFDDLRYICSDFVILSAGVLGTSEILFQSQRRGLALSERLGFGLSCNGNNVAYAATSRAPLNAYGLNKKQFSEAPIESRPGPAISASFTSSNGFTIQSAVLPTSYPYLLFKGIVTYGWPSPYSLLHCLINIVKFYIMGPNACQAMALNVMGHDACDGRITFDEETEKIRLTPPQDPLLPKKILALQNITRKLGGILFMSKYRSTSVHLLGGCNAAPNASLGVCSPNGHVYNPSTNQSTVHEGLFVSDASLIPCSIGVNPCLAITTIAEHISKNLVDDVLRFKVSVLQREDIQKEPTKKTMNSVPNPSAVENLSERMVVVKEKMSGFIGGMPCTAYLTMNINCKEEQGFQHKNLSAGYGYPLLKGRVDGYVDFLSVSKEKLFILDGKVDLCKINNRTPYTQYMHYSLPLVSASGSRYILEGKKVMNPFLLASYAWREATTLHVNFQKVEMNSTENEKQQISLTDEILDLQGELHISIFQLLKSLAMLKGKNKDNFVRLLLLSFWRTYILQEPRYSEEDFSLSELIQHPYPVHVLHQLNTEDDYTITCMQWRSTQSLWKPELKTPQPVLLLNGYAGESYYLPTEPRDLVRTLLEEGYEIWLLQTRLHPTHPSNNFTIEDIAKFDIPAVIAKIHEEHGSSIRIHVIAHCAGGLAIHMALLGGHVSASCITSLSCTNSSMYFKLTTLASVKMRLPLLPVTMAIIGKKKTLSITDSSKDEIRHSLLKWVARIIPRTERCSCDECEIVSGVFGNPYWHENVSKTLHRWTSKQCVTHLPMSGLPHLRKVCNAGHIVDAQGKNNYMIHPERIALPTLYISGGRSLLVTPETSLMANRYMRMHQPEFEHKRVVLAGFGHSDLLIGEESYKRVFPHFVSHMRMAEEGGRRKGRGGGWEKSVVSWEALHDVNGAFGSFASILCLIIFFIFCGYFYLRI